MSARKRGNNKRQPRTSVRMGTCISIMPDGTVKDFKPEPPKQRVGLTQLDDGSWIVTVKERGLL